MRRTFGASFKSALAGLGHTFKSERNFRIHTVAALIVITLALVMPLARWEQAVLVISVVGVLIIELINTAMEYILDLLKPRFNQYVGWVKDIMAAATLVAVVGAVLCGFIILFPHFIDLLK